MQNCIPFVDPIVMMLIFCQKPSGDGTIGAPANETTTCSEEELMYCKIDPKWW